MVTNVGFLDAFGVTLSETLNMPDGVAVESPTLSPVTTFDGETLVLMGSLCSSWWTTLQGTGADSRP